MFRKIIQSVFPESLWTKRFAYWWIVCLVSLLAFDVMWMAQTTFRPFTFVAFYPYLLLNATLLSLPALLSKRAWIQGSVLLLADIVMIANLMYCRTYFNGIPAESYLLIGNLADFGDSVAGSFRWYFAALPLFTAAAWIASPCFVSRTERRPQLVPYLLTLLVLGVLAWAADAWRGQSLMKTVDKMRNECKEYMCVLPVYQISGYVVLDLLSADETPTPETLQDVNSWLEEHRNITAPYLDSRQASDTLVHPRNLLIILCESFESWVLGKEVEGKEITPNLNKLLKDSLTFYAPNVLTQVGHGRSIDGQLLVLTGLQPHSSRVYAFQQTDNQYFSLPKAMGEYGGKSTLLTGDKPQVWNQGMVASAFGFDSVIHNSSWNLTEPDGTRRRHLSDGALMLQSVEKMKKGEILTPGRGELILWVTHSGHHPFKVGKNLKRIEFKNEYSESIADFMTAANYTDHSIGLLVDYLKTRPDWNETMVVVTGDHEGLGQLRSKAMKDPRSAAIVDSMPHTPLIIINSPVPGRYDGEMGQVDIYSTLLDLMGWYGYSWTGMGQSVFDPAFPGAAFSTVNGTVSQGRKIDQKAKTHLEKAQKVSSDIIQHDLLRVHK